MKLEEKFIEILKEPICDNCLGRTCGNLVSGMTNLERGKMIRTYVSFLLDSGEVLNNKETGLYIPNFRDIKFRNIKLKIEESEDCKICGGFFTNRIEKLSKEAARKMGEYEFSSFLVGSIPTNEMQNAEEEIWNRVGIDDVELVRAEINREMGKRVEKLTESKFNKDDPDIVVLFDMKRNEIRLQVKSTFVSGGYKKLVRGIPQTRWTCMECGGKGCVECKGVGKRYKTSVHEIIGKPLMKAADGKDHAFHGSGREDIDARCLDYRQFVLEVIKPKKRTIKLKDLEKQINKSKKVNVKGLKVSNKEYVRKIKSDRNDKTYSAEVIFEKQIDKKLLPKIRTIKGIIRQNTPTRVKHRRADLLRKRGVRSISYKALSGRKLRVVVRGEAGLYIKELMSGDEGRTRPNVSDLINNKVKSIVLDVIKIHKVKNK